MSATRKWAGHRRTAQRDLSRTTTTKRRQPHRGSLSSADSFIAYIRPIMVPWRSSVPRKRSGLAPAAFIDPCLPTRIDKAPSADGWVHEIKHDGFRLQVHAYGKRVRLYTMTGVDWTARYPWIVQDVARLNLPRTIIDAECCCDGDNGITDFNRLHSRVHDASAYAYAFDLLTHDGDDTRPLPLSERKAAPGQTLAPRQAGHPLQRAP